MNKIFNFIVRMTSGDMSAQMRRVGNDFHRMVEKERQDLLLLEQKVRDLSKAERLAAKATKDAERDRVNAINATSAATKRSQQAIENRYNPKIQRVDRDLTSALGAQARAQAQLEKAREKGNRTRAAHAGVLTRQEREHTKAVVEVLRNEEKLRKIREATLDLNRRERDHIHTVRTKRRETFDKERDKVRELRRRVKLDQAEQKALSKEDLELVRKHQAELRRLDQTASRVRVPRLLRLTPAQEEEGTPTAIRVRSSAREEILRQITYRRASHAQREFDLIQKRRDLIIKSPTYDPNVPPDAGIEAERARLRTERAQVQAELDKARTRRDESEAKARQARTKKRELTPDEVAATTQVERTTRRVVTKKNERAALRSGREAELEVERVKGAAAQASVEAHHTPIIEARRQAQEQAHGDTETARDNKRAGEEILRQKQLEVRDLKAAREGIKQHLWGTITELVAKVGFVTAAFGRFSRMVSAAAEFHFKAQGLSTLLGAERGTGQDIYGSYARGNAYQSEVSPTAAVSRMGELAAAGYSRGEISSATESAFNVLLAARGEVSEAGAFDLGISLHRAFGSEGQSMGALIDTVVSTANRFPMTVGKVRDALAYATEAAGIADQSLEETLLMIGTVMPVVKTPSKAGTVTRNAMLSLAKPKGQKILAGLGVSATTSNGATRDTMDVFMDIRDALLKVQQQDIAGTYKDPFGKKLKPDELAKRVDELNLKKQQIEYELTGQRGGAIFTGLERLPALATSFLRGTAFEGMTFKDPREALEAMRDGLQDTAGETRRMADELRRTSFVLGQSFDASVEKFKISLGTFMLPMRDAFLSMWKNALDSISSYLSSGTGQPGGRPPGTSAGLNVAAGLVQYGMATMALKQVGNLWSTWKTAKTLLSPTGMRAVASAMSSSPGMTAWEAAASVSAGAGATTMFGKATAAVGGFVSGVLRVLGPIGLLAGGLWTIYNGIMSASRALTDFTNVTIAAHTTHQDRVLSAISMILKLKAEGGLKMGPWGGIQMTPGQAKILRQGGSEAGTFLYNMLHDDVRGALNSVNTEELRKIEDIADPAKKDELRKKWSDRFNALQEENPYFDSLTSGKSLNVDTQALRYENMRRTYENDVISTRFGNEKGGPDKYVLWTWMKKYNATSYQDLQSKLGWWDRTSLSREMGRARLDADPDSNWYERLFGRDTWDSPDAGNMARYGRVAMKDYNESGQYIPGLKGSLTDVSQNEFARMLLAFHPESLSAEELKKQTLALANIERNTRNIAWIPGMVNNAVPGSTWINDFARSFMPDSATPTRALAPASTVPQ